MTITLSKSEIRASLRIGAEQSAKLQLPDPWQWQDLSTQEHQTQIAVETRVRESRTPHRSHVFRWPKEGDGYRPLAALDPLDQIIYRSLVGRMVVPVTANLDPDAVLSSQIRAQPPAWELESWGIPIAERRGRGLELIARHPILGLIDVQNYYPNVQLATLAETLASLPIDEATTNYTVDWIGELQEVSGVAGIPTGHDPSRILGDAVLIPCDTALTALGHPFMRYVDDTWFFVDTEEQYEIVIRAYEHVASELGLVLHPTKTRPLSGLEARNEIHKVAIVYFGDALNDPGPGLRAGQQLFEESLEDPVRNKSELRRALRTLTDHRSPYPLETLRANPDLLRVAPLQWVKYMSALIDAKKTRQLLDDDWVLEQITQEVTKETGYRNLLFIQVGARMKLDKQRGTTVFELATCDGPWNGPLRVWGAYAWGRSGAFKPNKAVEQFEAHGDYSTRRAFAMTLDRERNNPKLSRWTREIRVTHSDFEPTACWLEAA